MDSPSRFPVPRLAFSVRRIKMEASTKPGFRCSWAHSVDCRLERCRSWRCLKKRCYSCFMGLSRRSVGWSFEGELAAGETGWRSGWFRRCWLGFGVERCREAGRLWVVAFAQVRGGDLGQVSRITWVGSIAVGAESLTWAIGKSWKLLLVQHF